MGVSFRRSGLLLFWLLAFALAGVFASAARSEAESGGGAAVLLFHSVGERTTGDGMVVSASDLALTLDLLKRDGFSFITLDRLHAYLEGKASVPPKAVLVAFDDGYADNYTRAHPVLTARKVPAVVFPVAKWFSPHPRPEKALPHLTAGQAKAMLSSGLWSFGSHSYDGHRKEGTRAWLLRRPGEPLGDYRARVWADLALSRHVLEDLGAEISDFAPPYGACDGELVGLARAAGFRWVHVQAERLNRPGQGPYVYRVVARSPEQVVHTLERLFR